MSKLLEGLKKNQTKLKSFMMESLDGYDFMQFYKGLGTQSQTYIPTFSISKYNEHLKKSLSLSTDRQANAIKKGTEITSQTRRETFEELQKLRGKAIVETILDIIYDDAISGNNANNIFSVSFTGDAGERNNKEIQKLFDDFTEDLRTRQLIKDIAKPTIHYGEYMVGMEIDVENKQKGVMAINDNVDIINTSPIYSGQKLIGFVEKDAKGNELKIYPPEAILHFCFDGEKLRLFESSFMKKGKKLKEYIKTGKSIFYGATVDIRQLDMIKMGNLSITLKKIISPILVMLGIPDETNSQDAIEIKKYQEQKLNDIFRNLGQIDDLNFKQVLQNALRFEVLLNFGSGKGSIENLNLDQSKEADRQKEIDLKTDICTTVGIPPALVLSESGETKIDSVKRHSRYSHRLNSVQSTFIEPLRDLYYIHAKYSGFNIERKNIEITMQQITNVEMLDDMEWLIAGAEAESNFLRYLNEVSQSTQGKLTLDAEEYHARFKERFKQMSNTENLLKYIEKPPQPEQPQGGGFGGF